MIRHASIIVTGPYLPEIEAPNSVLREQFAHVPDLVDKMEAATGIRERWYAPKGLGHIRSLLGLPGAPSRAGRKPEDVGLIILGTDSPESITPAPFVVLEYKLDAKKRRHLRCRLRVCLFSTSLAASRRPHRRQPRSRYRSGRRRVPHA
jgi:3-oxoacyl-[acyl-carrier-protein] synthase-3